MTTGTIRRIAPPTSFDEWLMRVILRTFYWLTLRLIMGPPWPIWFQRGMLSLLATIIPTARGVSFNVKHLKAITVEIVTPDEVHNDAVLLYLHGGAFMLGNPRTHRAITSRLAALTGAHVWVPDYRRAPEHRYPIALDDCIDCYRTLLDQGVSADRIVVAGDSAGGSLALALSIKLRTLKLPQPAGLMVISPVCDSNLDKSSCQRYRFSDPMIRLSFLRASFPAYGLPLLGSEHHILQNDLQGLPPLLIHVGTDEVLHDDSVQLADHASQCGVRADLVIYQGLWHVLHLSAPFLPTARQALEDMALRFDELTRREA